MKRVLVISYYWPPSGGSGVQRWVKFAKYLPQEGWQVVVYTPSNPQMPALDESLCAEVADVEVVRREIFEPYALHERLFGKSKKKAPQVNLVDAGKKSWKERLAMWVRGNFFIPDPKCLWVGPSVRFLKKYLQEHPVDAIVSTGPPHSMHLIARRLSKATGLPWVADFRDPWTRIFYFKHLSLGFCAARRHRLLEQKVLTDATEIVAVSPRVQQEFEQMTSTPVSLITNGYDPEDFQGDVQPDGYFNMTHTGLFARDGIPSLLWKVLAEKRRSDALFAEKFRLRLLGKTDQEVLDEIRAAGLEDALVNLGYQDHAQAVYEQRNATLLLLPLRKEPEYKSVLPGKLFEYLGARRPILGVGDADGAMADVIRETRAGVVIDWTDQEAMAAYVDKIWQVFLQGESPSSGDISRYSRQSTAAAMARLLDKIQK